jgi:hypothetical protein
MVMYLMSAISLHAASFSKPKDASLRDASNPAVHPEWQMQLEEQTEWWRVSLLPSQTQPNAEFTIQLSGRPIGRAK